MSNSRTHQGNSRHSVIRPYQIGMLLDRHDAAHHDLRDAVLLAIEECRECGELDREVQLVVKEVNAAPDGSVLDAEAAWDTITSSGLMMAMIGPFDHDNGATLRERIERHAIPTLTYCASDAMTGNYCFQLPLGHLADTAHRLLRHARSLGKSNPILVRERGPRGAAAEASFRQAASQDRFKYVDVAVLDSSLVARLTSYSSQGADALIYLGSDGHDQIDRALAVVGWDPLRLTGFEFAAQTEDSLHPANHSRWVTLAATHDENRIFTEFTRAFESRYGRKAAHVYAAVGYDIGRLLAEVLSTVRPPSPEGVRAGLDELRMRLSAVGRPGTVISFSRYDHRGFKGDPYSIA